ncbi:MAG TPA: hypothetical protein VGJ81_18665 [Thermoanaerobaculia bacterium]|jgi:hypothetical protein
MADTEHDALIDQVKNGSAFESLRAATRLAQLARAKKSARSTVAGLDLSDVDLSDIAGEVETRRVLVEELQRTIGTQPALRPDSAETGGTVRPNNEGLSPGSTHGRR